MRNCLPVTGKYCTFENLSIPSSHSDFLMVWGSCYAIGPYYVSSECSLWCSTSKFSLLNFTPLHITTKYFTASFIICVPFITYQIFLAFQQFYISLCIIFLEIIFFLLVENYTVMFFPYGDSEHKLAKPSVIFPNCSETAITIYVL